MEIVTRFVLEMWDILLDSSPYIIIGIVAAGFIKVYLKKEFIAKHLQKGRFVSVIKASFFGVPLPL